MEKLLITTTICKTVYSLKPSSVYMKLKDLRKISLKTIIKNKLRSWLSMLWIIIGVVTIILVNAIGQWAKKQIDDQFSNLSVTSIFVFPGRWFTLEVEAIDLVKSVETIADAAGFFQSSFSMASSEYDSNFATLWISESYGKVNNIKLSSWRLLTAEDDKQKVTVIWQGIIDELFPGEQPATLVGKMIKINKKEFEIVGTLEETWNSFWPFSQDDSAYVPINTYQKFLDRSASSVRISALATDVDTVSQAVEDVTALLEEEYDLEPNSNNLRIIDAWWSVATAQWSAEILSVLLIWIAWIVFLVSWIWIMNVMFAAVAERTKEIWILKSIGADRDSILRQFLLESIMLTWLASIIWVIIWEVLINIDIIGEVLPLATSISWDLLAVAFALGTWVFFGRYPARRASKLDPVDALRS